MVVVRRMTAAATMIVAATISAVVGCSNPGTPTSSGTPTTGQSASTSSRPAVASAVPQAPKPGVDTAAGGIDVTIAAKGSTTVRPGGPPMRFNVKLVNNGADIARVGMVVSLGHCSCSPSGSRMMPAGSMRMLDPQTNAWVAVPYVSEGTGMDYIYENLVPPFPLAHGQTVTYQLQMQLNADQKFTVEKGKSAIHVTPTDPADPTRNGFRDAQSLPITVEP